MDVRLEDAAAVDGEGVSDVADLVTFERLDVGPFFAAGCQDLKTASAATEEHGEASEIAAKEKEASATWTKANEETSEN